MSLSEDPPSPATNQNIHDKSRNLKPRAKPTEIIKHTNENIELYKKCHSNHMVERGKGKTDF